MTQTIDHYISDEEDQDTIAEIAKTYGGQLEKLDREQKFTFLSRITEELYDRDGSFDIAPDLHDRIAEMSNDSLLVLTSFLAEQLRQPELDEIPC